MMPRYTPGMKLIDRTDGKPVIVSGRDGHGNLQVRKRTDKGTWYTLTWVTGRFGSTMTKERYVVQKPRRLRHKQQTSTNGRFVTRPLTDARVPGILRIAANMCQNQSLIAELTELADMFESGQASINAKAPSVASDAAGAG